MVFASTLKYLMTLSMEKIPVLLRPIIISPDKSMASIGSQKKSRNMEILSILAKF